MAPTPGKCHVRICSRQQAVRVPRKRIGELIAFAARAEKVRIGEIDVAVVSPQQIASMNRRYLGHRGATDVLSFDLSGPSSQAAGICGQIVVCGAGAVREARGRGFGPQRELLLYVLHGLLHLVGYDDSEPSAAAVMSRRQEELLDAFLKRGLRHPRR